MVAHSTTTTTTRVQLHPGPKDFQDDNSDAAHGSPTTTRTMATGADGCGGQPTRLRWTMDIRRSMGRIDDTRWSLGRFTKPRTAIRPPAATRRPGGISATARQHWTWGPSATSAAHGRLTTYARPGNNDTCAPAVSRPSFVGSLGLGSIRRGTYNQDGLTAEVLRVETSERTTAGGWSPSSLAYQVRLDGHGGSWSPATARGGWKTPVTVHKKNRHWRLHARTFRVGVCRAR
jgi:hypothetical protein